MALSTIETHGSYERFRNASVYQCRLGVHSLGPQDDDKSENHLTLYLLIGSEQCVRVDMRPNVSRDYKSHLGKLVLRGHDYSRSTGVIAFSDVDAVGCPSDFDPSRRATSTSESRTVNDFVNLLRQYRLKFFRFMNIDGKSLGCRSWMYVLFLAQSIVSMR